MEDSDPSLCTHTLLSSFFSSYAACLTVTLRESPSSFPALFPASIALFLLLFSFTPSVFCSASFYLPFVLVADVGEGLHFFLVLF